MRIRFMVLAALLGAAAGGGALAEGWSEDPLVNTPVVTAPGTQFSQRIIHDGKGGYFVVWQDGFGSAASIYAQHFNKNGIRSWVENGMPVCSVPDVQVGGPLVLLDNSGGVIVAWKDSRGDYSLYAQRLDSSGDPMWADNGILVIDGDDDLRGIVSDGANGAIVVTRGGRVNRIAADGTLPWSAPVRYESGSLEFPMILSDGKGGAFVCWARTPERNEYILLAQRIDSRGTPLWNDKEPVAVSDTDNAEYSLMVGDGSGGIILTWWDEDGSRSDLRAQRLNGNGVRLWGAAGENGIQVADNRIMCQHHGLVQSTAGAVVAVWRNEDDGDEQFYARKIRADGSLAWDGAVQLTRAGRFWGTEVPDNAVSDGAGGAIYVFLSEGDDESWHTFVRAQRVTTDGEVMWGDAGLAVCVNTLSEPSRLRMAGNGQGSAVVVWRDERNSATTNSDIYMQGITAEGALGTPDFTPRSPKKSGCATGAGSPAVLAGLVALALGAFRMSR